MAHLDEDRAFRDLARRRGSTTGQSSHAPRPSQPSRPRASRDAAPTRSCAARSPATRTGSAARWCGSRILPRRALLRRRDRARPRADGGALRPRAGAIPRRRRRPLLPAAHGAWRSLPRCIRPSCPARRRAPSPGSISRILKLEQPLGADFMPLDPRVAGSVGKGQSVDLAGFGVIGEGRKGTARVLRQTRSSRSARCRSQTASSSSPTRSAGRKLRAPAPAGAIPAGRSSPADRAATSLSASCRGRRGARLAR